MDKKRKTVLIAVAAMLLVVATFCCRAVRSRSAS